MRRRNFRRLIMHHIGGCDREEKPLGIGNAIIPFLVITRGGGPCRVALLRRARSPRAEEPASASDGSSSAADDRNGDTGHWSALAIVFSVPALARKKKDYRAVICSRDGVLLEEAKAVSASLSGNWRAPEGEMVLGLGCIPYKRKWYWAKRKKNGGLSAARDPWSWRSCDLCRVPSDLEKRLSPPLYGSIYVREARGSESCCEQARLRWGSKLMEFR